MALLRAGGLELSLADRAAPGLFSRRRVSILKGIDLEIDAGESLAIVGESGSGKTSLGRTLLRLHEPAAGTLWFDGHDITHLPEAALRPLRARMQFIFQDPLSSLNPRHRIEDILAQPLQSFGLVKSRRAARAEACRLLERVDLPVAFARRYPHELSGGQRQRVGIARAISVRPKLIVADEIVSGLDVSTQARILLLLREISRETALVFISHDLSVVRVLCDRVMVMREGRVVEQGPTDALFASPRQAYTRELLDAIPLPEVEPGWLG